MKRLSHHSPCGFTLIELLVGVTIATFIMGSAAVVFVTTLENWERGKREEKLLRAAQTTGDLIERYLRCAVPPAGTSTSEGLTGEDLSTEEVDAHRLTFISTAEGRFPRSAGRTDKVEVEFCYDPETNPVMTMRIDSTPDDDMASGGVRIQLSPLIQAFRVTYFDGIEWLGDWYDSRLPKAVEFHLIIGDPEDLDAEGNMRTREFSRLVWIPMGKERPPEETGDPTNPYGDSSTNPPTMGGGER